MLRRHLPLNLPFTLLVAGLMFTLLNVRAADPIPVKKIEVKKTGDRSTADAADPAVLQGDAANTQERLRRQFDEFKQSLLRLAQRLENSSRPEDREKAAVLKKAIAQASEQGIDTKFTTLVTSLKGADTFKNLEQLVAVMEKNDDLRKDIRNLIELLLKDDQEGDARRKRDEYTKILEKLKEIIREQEIVRSNTELGRKTAEQLKKEQDKVTKKTGDLVAKRDDKNDGKDGKPADPKADAKPMKDADGKGKGEAKDDTKDPKGDSRSKDGKEDAKDGKDSKDGKGDPKDGKGDAKDGKGDPKDGKGDPKDGKGDPKDGKGDPKDGKGDPKDGKGDPKDGKGDGKGDPKDSKGDGKGDPKDGKGDPKDGKGDPKDGKGDPKDGKGDGKDGKGDPKDGKGDPKDGKGGDPKDGKGDGKGDPKDSKGDGKGDPKDGKGGDPKAGKPGDPKDGKPGDAKGGKPGDPKDGKPGDPKGGKPGDGKPGDPKDGKGKPSEAKSGSDSKGKSEGKGDAKAGKPGDGKPSDGNPSEAKGGQKGEPGKPGQGQAKGDPQQGQPGQPPPGGPKPPPGDQQAQDSNPVKKQIQEGNKSQEKAGEDLAKKNPKDAGENQDDALRKLNEAKKKLEDLLRQLREEEIERILAALQGRCERMLAMQIAVRNDTVVLDKIIQGTADKKPTRADEQASNVLSDREEEIVRECNKALNIVRAEGSAVAFAEVFEQVQKDMVTVAGRLRKTDAGLVTVTIENDIIATLGEMIDALKKARQDNQKPKPPKPGQPGQSGPPPDQKLIDMLAELKMIRSMQKRVNDRTEVYGKQYEGEQAPPPRAAPDDKARDKYESIQRELRDLGTRQDKIGKIVSDIAKGRNKTN